MDLGPELVFTGRTEVVWEGRRLLFFAGNDYHRFSSHPSVVEALISTTYATGINACGSRMTTANHPLYGEVERNLALFLGVEAAAVSSAGYLSNLILAQAGYSRFHRVFTEPGVHASLTDAAAIAGLPVVLFPPHDPDGLRDRLRSALLPGECPLLVVEGVTPSTGTMPPLAAYDEVLREYGGRIHLDDAHGAGVVGAHGQGSWHEAGLPANHVFLAGTFSKALGGFGGFVAGSAELIEAVRQTPAFIGSTPPPLPQIGASLRSLRILRDWPALITNLRERTLAVKERLRTAGYDLPETPSPILSVHYDDPEKTRRLRNRLLERGIYPPFINYPGAPAGGHFRFTLSSAHSHGQVSMLLDALEA